MNAHSIVRRGMNMAWRRRLLLVAALFATAGVFMLANSMAATFGATSEAEAGQLATAKVVDEAGASGGQAVLFANADVPAGSDRPIPDPLYGVTLDNDSGIAQGALNNQLAALQHLPHMPTTRVVFDETAKPSDYAVALAKLRPASYIMGELMDSYYLKNYTA